MNNTCPECGAVYNVSVKDIGRRVACRKCKSALVIDESGLRLDGQSDAALTHYSPPLNGGTAVPSTARDEVALPAANATERLRSRLGVIRDWPAVLLAAGLFLVTAFHFFPRIDESLVASRKAEVLTGAMEDAADDRDTTAKNGGKPTDAEKEARRKRSDDWQKARQRLDDRAALAELDAARALPWNYRGQMFGYSLLIVAGVGLLWSDTAQRKIVGAVLLLLLFLTVTHTGVNVSLGEWGKPAPKPTERVP